MKRGLFTFSKPTANGITASNRIAKFCEEQLDIPLMWDEAIAQKFDVLYIVAGAYAFCDALPAIGAAVAQAGRVIWIQNDYTVIPPKAVSNAESPFRKAFRTRRAAGLPDIEYWTTIQRLNSDAPSTYINWNMLTWEPLTDKEYVEAKSRGDGSVLYYGAFRQDRAKTFDKFFNMRKVPWTISGSSPKFVERYPHLQDSIYKTIPRDQFQEFLAGHALGLYIEDDKSHHEFHSPANRFYEMLGSRLPMVFQREAVNMLSRAGINAKPWVVETEADILTALRSASIIGRKQREQYFDDYRAQLVTQVKKARKAVERA